MSPIAALRAHVAPAAMMALSVPARILRHDRLLTGLGLASAAGLSWAYLLVGAGMDMHEMDGMSMPMAATEWTPWTFGLMLTMWALMMAAMMLPSAAPMILLYATLASRSRAKGGRPTTPAFFAGGYLAVWLAFSVGAVSLQYALERAALLSPTMQLTSAVLGGLVLIAAGVYQWTPLKQACLRHCRSPLEFLMSRWRRDAWGVFAMGLRHGAYCLGCCWALMLLLFVGGVMNLTLVGGLALFVLVEKLAPAGHWIAKTAGAALLGAGALILWCALGPTSIVSGA